ncbi:MAG: RNA-binding protein hfq [Phormidesmis sp. RL_2_1]|nr:RNA-binding protein hfq [Phormidesmis sp. RL_2_1]
MSSKSTSANSFDLELPSIRQVQSIIRDQKTVEIKVTTGETLVGAVIWQDANAICVKGDDGQSTILMRGAIAYVKAH